MTSVSLVKTLFCDFFFGYFSIVTRMLAFVLLSHLPKPRNSAFKLLCMNFLDGLDTLHTMCLVESQLTDLKQLVPPPALAPSSIYYYTHTFSFQRLKINK